MFTIRLRCVSVLLVAGTVLLHAAAARAQAADDKAWVKVSGYRPKVDSDLQISRRGTRLGTRIDFERDLDLDPHQWLPAVSAGVRVGRRWRIAGDFYRLSRTGERTLSAELVVDDVTYAASAALRSKLASDIYRVNVGYSFIRTPEAELGVAIGAHMTSFTVSLEGSGTIQGGPSGAHLRRRKLFAPLPTVGVYGALQVLPNTTLSASADYLSLGLGDYRGRLINAEASLSYRFTRNVGAGVMYRFVSYRVDVDRNDWLGTVGYRFSGPAVFLEAGF